MTQPLKAPCGDGDEYNFNEKVQCGQSGTVGDKLVNLTDVDHVVAAKHLSFDGIHHSNTANKVVARAFLDGTHIVSSGASIACLIIHDLMEGLRELSTNNLCSQF